MKVDLKDAYFSIPIDREHWKYLCFKLGAKTYQFTCLPFGLTSAPWVFTKTVKPIAALKRELGFRLVIYIDDILLMAESRELALEQGSALILVPRLHHKHGENSEATNPNDRDVNGAKSPHREVEKDLGGVPEAYGGGTGFNPRPLQTNWQNECCQPGNPTSTFILQIPTDGSDVCLEEGRQELRYSPSSVSEQHGGAGLVGHSDGPLEWEDHPDEGLIIESDASTQGWGATCQGSDTGGPWSALEKTWHINCLELLAATLALKTFVKNKTKLSVLLKLDNTSAVAYINNQGGTVSKKLVTLTRDLWMWCLERNIHIQAQYLPGAQNCIADRESRS